MKTLAFFLIFFLCIPVFSDDTQWILTNGFGTPTAVKNEAPSNSNVANGGCPAGYMASGSVCTGTGFGASIGATICPSGNAPDRVFGKESCPAWDRPGTSVLESQGQRTGSEEKSSETFDATACDTAQTSTEKACKGSTWAETNGAMVQQLSSMVGMASAATNTAQACKASQQLNTLLAAANGTIAFMCGSAAMKCRSACKGDETEQAECSKLANSSKSTAVQGFMNAGNAAMAKEVCDTVASGDSCLGDAAYNNENCMQFCLKPGRQSHPKCQTALNHCANSTYAAQNVQYCTCVNNPFAPNCSTVTGTGTNPAGSSKNGLNFDDSLAGSDYDFDGVTGAGKDAKVNTPQGSGSSGGGLGGGSFAMPGDDSGGNGDDPLSKDILNGTGGGAGAAAIYGGGGYNDGAGGAANKGSGKKDDGFDLRAFLPGGKKAANRNPASAGYADPTITKANGLTNWQKVTRKMNEKRPELMP